MVNLRALFTGAIVIIILGLVLQLVLLLLATGYTVFTRDYPELKLVSLVLAYTFGIFCYFLVMSIGGYITSNLAKRKIYLHCLIIGLLTTGVSLITSIRNNEFTFNTILFILSGTAFTLMGGYIWIKNESIDLKNSVKSEGDCAP